MPTADFGRRVEATIESIDENDDIHPENKAEIRDFKRDLGLEGLSDAWLQKLTAHLKIIAEHLGQTRFEDMDKGDVKDLVEWCQNRTKDDGEEISEATVNAYKQVIKRFWRWRAGTPKGEHPEPVAWINTTANAGGNGKLPTDLLDREDVDALKDGCRNPRDTAFIAMLYETGARIGEIIDLTVGDIEDHTHGRKVVIDGKTGQRRLPLVESTPALNKWLNEHPSAEDRNAPLWCQLRNGDKQLSYHYIRQKLLDRAKERAEIDKPVNPHHFRHSRASHLANEFTEAQLCEWFGWVQGSDVPAKYVHLSGRDIDKAYYQEQGIETAEEDEEDTDPVQECPRCEELNEPSDKFCARCGQALEIGTAEVAQDVEDKILDFISMAETPEEAQIGADALQKFRNSEDKGEALDKLADAL